MTSLKWWDGLHESVLVAPQHLPKDQSFKHACGYMQPSFEEGLMWSKCIMKVFIARFVVWENPNPNHKYVTQLGKTILVTSIDVPLILVKDKSNRREASWMTLGGLQWEKKSA
jgi:hypothetical protein